MKYVLEEHMGMSRGKRMWGMLALIRVRKEDTVTKKAKLLWKLRVLANALEESMGI
jgi:hypothetical protein